MYIIIHIHANIRICSIRWNAGYADTSVYDNQPLSNGGMDHGDRISCYLYLGERKDGHGFRYCDAGVLFDHSSGISSWFYGNNRRAGSFVVSASGTYYLSRYNSDSEQEKKYVNFSISCIILVPWVSAEKHSFCCVQDLI